VSPLLVYLDTGPLKGLLDPHDQAHERARELFRQATDQGARLLTPYPALLELHRLLMYRKPPRSDAAKLAVTALQRVMESYPAVHPSPEDAQAAVRLLARFDDQKITLADATIATMAVRAGAQVMTLDQRHFRMMQASVWPDP
jgi:predicted nucleic acid-binding protein